MRRAFLPSFWFLLGCGLDFTSAFSYAEEAQTKAKLPNEITDSALLNSRFLLFGSGNLHRQTLKWTSRNRRMDMVPALIISLRYLPEDRRLEVVETLKRVTRKRFGDDWFRWMQWQQANPEIKPFDGYDVFLSAVFGNIDPGFRDFIYPRVKRSIRLEEIVWGGVAAGSGIPPLNHPDLVPGSEVAYLDDQELVFGVSINGDVRAYPYRIMDWHEMLNDTVGGQPVSLAYCTLCGSGILFDTTHADQTFSFGSSGLLFQSNKLMFDRGTNSLWNQFTGRPVVGTLTDSGIELETLPLVTTTWGQWRRQHPDTKVLSLETGFERDYRPGQPYGAYFKSPRLMFPSLTDDKQLKQKEQVFGLRLSGANRAWPLKDFKSGQVINDQVGVLGVVLVGDADSRSVRAYRDGGYDFRKFGTSLEKIEQEDGGVWQVTEPALIGPDGQQLTRLPGHLAFWFAWHNYLGGDSLRKAP
ncbi:MAG: DUF3179 domain-containing protein [Pseudomonadota bacterium]